MSADDLSGLDTRSPELRRLDFMVDQVGDLASSVRELVERIPQGHTQTVIHKTQGMGAWGAAAVTACFMTMLVLVIVVAVSVSIYGKDQGGIDGRLRDLDAWRGQHSREIDTLKSNVRQLQEKSK